MHRDHGPGPLPSSASLSTLTDVGRSSLPTTSMKRRELKWIAEAVKSRSVSGSLLSLARRRKAGEPLQYILGTQPFGHLELLTRPPVLIPRPETEDWTFKLSEHIRPTLQKPISVLDLCTGTGCIPLLLCSIWPKGSVRAYGVDISPDAIHLAQDNARKCAISPQVFTPVLADLLSPSFALDIKAHNQSQRFDLLTANPPYIPQHEYDQLPSCVKDHEDPRALLAGGGLGLSFYHAIARLVKEADLLSKQANIVLEVGDGQASAVSTILRDGGDMSMVQVWKDPWGKDRVVVACTT